MIVALQAIFRCNICYHMTFTHIVLLGQLSYIILESLGYVFEIISVTACWNDPSLIPKTTTKTGDHLEMPWITFQDEDRQAYLLCVEGSVQMVDAKGKVTRQQQLQQTHREGEWSLDTFHILRYPSLTVLSLRLASHGFNCFHDNKSMKKNCQHLEAFWIWCKVKGQTIFWTRKMFFIEWVWGSCWSGAWDESAWWCWSERFHGVSSLGRSDWAAKWSSSKNRLFQLFGQLKFLGVRKRNRL